MRSRKLTRWVASLAIPPLAGCGILSTEVPLTEEGALKALPPIEYHDYCSAQKGIADHNSRWKTLESKKPTVYKAPCELEQGKKIARGS